MTTPNNTVAGLAEKLLPCPFCGGRAKTKLPYVRCTECGGQMCYGETSESDSAIAAWNRRASPAPSAPAEYMRHPSGDGTIVRKDDPSLPLSVDEILAAMRGPSAPVVGDAMGHIAMLRSLRMMYDDGLMQADDHPGTVAALDAAIAALSGVSATVGAEANDYERGYWAGRLAERKDRPPPAAPSVSPAVEGDGETDGRRSLERLKASRLAAPHADDLAAVEDLIDFLYRRLATPEQPGSAVQGDRKVAPWPDYAGNPIHEGDTIQHPTDGATGVVFVLVNEADDHDRWRVLYNADVNPARASRLCLQIDYKGQAVVQPPAPAAEQGTITFLHEMLCTRYGAFPKTLDTDASNITEGLYWAIGEYIEKQRQATQPEARGVEGMVLAEVERATAKFPTWPTDPLHAVAVLGEEFGELTKAVLQSVYEPHKNPPGAVRTEALQTAAMALRFLASVDRYEAARCPQHKQGEQ